MSGNGEDDGKYMYRSVRTTIEIEEEKWYRKIFKKVSNLFSIVR